MPVRAGLLTYVANLTNKPPLSGLRRFENALFLPLHENHKMDKYRVTKCDKCLKRKLNRISSFTTETHYAEKVLREKL